MSIGSILNMARQGMAAQQAAVNTASQNIANAGTVGYSRQRVELQASLPTVFPYGSVGTGVDVAGISRARDSMLDAAAEPLGVGHEEIITDVLSICAETTVLLFSSTTMTCVLTKLISVDQA